ncbi:hypothetical protein AtNW77_Chr2g0224621 [Arabidopsis thaliana]
MCNGFDVLIRVRCQTQLIKCLVLMSECLMWFTRDTNSSLVRKITKVWTNKFDGLFYSSSCVPRDRREKYFLEFAV